MLSQLSGQEEPDSSLDLPGGDSRPLVVVSETGSLGSDPLEDVIHKAVHDAHCLGGDTGVRVDLLQNLVDVDGVRLLPLLLTLFLVSLGNGFLGLARLLGSLSGSFGWHVNVRGVNSQLIQSGAGPPYL